VRFAIDLNRQLTVEDNPVFISGVVGWFVGTTGFRCVFVDGDLHPSNPVISEYPTENTLRCLEHGLVASTRHRSIAVMPIGDQKIAHMNSKGRADSHKRANRWAGLAPLDEAQHRRAQTGRLCEGLEGERTL